MVCSGCIVAMVLEAPKVGASARRKIDALVERLDRIQQPAPETAAEPLEAFRSGYQELSPGDRPALFVAILDRLEVSRDEIGPTLKQLERADPNDAAGWSRAVTDLRRRVESPRLRAFRKFVNLSGGIKFLLGLRADVLDALHKDLDVQPLEDDLAHLFHSWFQQGFLFLEEISRDSPYRQIQFLQEHDMVHPMASLEEMGDRLGADRRCFALYHRVMPEEPIVFIEAALTRGMARSIHEVIEPGRVAGARSQRPDTAIFYSINNTQDGLAGLGLGRVLIFMVVEAIKGDQPAIKTFATLSPIPGFFPRYLKPLLEGRDEAFGLKRRDLSSYFGEEARKELIEHCGVVGAGAPVEDELAAAMLTALQKPAWVDDPVLVKRLRRPLRELAHFYLAREKPKRGRSANPVANFHLSNGASPAAKNVNFAGNRSERGLQDSCGLMVNYVYSRTWLDQIGRLARSLRPWGG